MITALHMLVYSDDATATRAFFQDVLRWPAVTDGGAGEVSGTADPGDTAGAHPDPSDWLIFATGQGELGVHPTMSEHEGQTPTSPRHHSISLMCDDLDATMAELSGRGARFTSTPEEMGFGRGVLLAVPGADDMLLYQPRHTTAYDR